MLCNRNRLNTVDQPYSNKNRMMYKAKKKKKKYNATPQGIALVKEKNLLVFPLSLLGFESYLKCQPHKGGLPPASCFSTPAWLRTARLPNQY